MVSVDLKVMTRLQIFSLSLLVVFVGGCASSSERAPAQILTRADIKIPSRDDIYGANRAKASVKPKPGKDYAFRNIASAFPDNGKNMLLKDRKLSKGAVSGAVDHSPWHLRVYENPAHIEKDKDRFSIANKDFYATPLTQKEAFMLAQAPKKVGAAQSFYQTDSYGIDDAFEPNQAREAAFDLSHSEDNWLGNVSTEGVQWDSDWYQVWVSPQYRRLVLDLRFQHYLGDIDFRLYDSKGAMLASSQGLSDDEFVNLILDHGGVYFVEVYGSSRGNRYDFKYATHFTGGGDDEYEDNDSLRMAYDLRSSEGKWLSENRGEGVAGDDDFYLVQAVPGRTRIIADLRVDIAKGDVDIRLLNSEGKVIASSSNIGDDDFIDFTVPTTGNYFLKVYPFKPQTTVNLYDLKWVAVKPQGLAILPHQEAPFTVLSQVEATNILSK